jgi:hypothetical protein
MSGDQSLNYDTAATTNNLAAPRAACGTDSQFLSPHNLHCHVSQQIWLLSSGYGHGPKKARGGLSETRA